MAFNIFAQLDKELTDYFEEEIEIGGANTDYETEEPYKFSQYQTLRTIDFYTASKFESGSEDADGTPKIFLNLVNFRAESAAKNIDLDVKDFAFIPEDHNSIYGALLMRKKFKNWAKEKYFGEMINEMGDDFPKYGSLVVKKIGKEIEYVPLQNIRIQQNAKDIQSASYFILEHKGMAKHEIEAMPDWNTDDLNLNWDGAVTVYERYGRVPLDFYKEYNGVQVNDGDEDKSIEVMAIVAPDIKKKKKDGNILYMIEVDERPFLEVHYNKVNGRWLGEGEVEKNFGNQEARNMVFNLRKRGLNWSVKNIFQTMDETMAKNLVREVRDGQVLKMSMQGGITRVDTTNRAVGDFNSMDNAIEENANQRSFTFEVATGESLPSGTPFRLGAMLSQSVNSYYTKKREKLGLFLTKIAWEFLVPMFEKDAKNEGVISMIDGEEGFELLREAKKVALLNRKIKKAVLSGENVNIEELKTYLDENIARTPVDFYKYQKDFWKNLNKTITIETTGETVNIEKQMETMVTLYQTLIGQGRADEANKILSKILAYTGEKMPSTSIKPQPVAPQQAPQLQNLVPQNEQVQ